VADQAASATGNTLAVELSKVKSLLTVNSSPLCQAIAGSLLLRSGISLNRAVQAKREWCHANRDVLLTSLAEEFAEFNDRVSWNQPQGGFFVTLTLPFQFDIDTARRCAANYGVIVCPMRFFCCGDNRNCQVRLAFSYVQVDDIGRGIKRLASFVRDEMQHS
jgi:(S)-3,5-dihydroxyphenylglycine transaminase